MPTSAPRPPIPPDKTARISKRRLRKSDLVDAANVKKLHSMVADFTEIAVQANERLDLHRQLHRFAINLQQFQQAVLHHPDLHRH